jgi:hypothetical protein
VVKDDDDELTQLLPPQPRPKTLVEPTARPEPRKDGPIVLKPIPEPAPLPAPPAKTPAPAVRRPEPTSSDVAWSKMLTGEIAKEAAALGNLANFRGTAPPTLVSTTLEVNITLRVTERAALATVLYDQLEPQGKLPLGVPNWRAWAGHALERYATILTPKMARRFNAETLDALKKNLQDPLAAAVDEGLRLAGRPNPDEDAVARRNGSEQAPDIPWHDASARIYVRVGIVPWGATRLYNALLKNRGLPDGACDWRPWTIHAMNVWADAALPMLEAAAGAAGVEQAKTLLRRR